MILSAIGNEHHARLPVGDGHFAQPPFFIALLLAIALSHAMNSNTIISRRADGDP